MNNPIGEDNYLMLSGIQHFAFCHRQWALIHIEQQWQDNYRTVDGELIHSRAHDKSLYERRKNTITRSSIHVKSEMMKVRGMCDIVQFVRSDKGIYLPGIEGTFRVEPVEYKRGNPKEHDSTGDIFQVAAQAMCLEEMLCCEIPIAYIYYSKIHHRKKIELTEQLRDKVAAMFEEMHRYYDRQYTPKAKCTKSCNACSLKELCLPELTKAGSVSEYIDRRIMED